MIKQKRRQITSVRNGKGSSAAGATDVEGWRRDDFIPVIEQPRRNEQMFGKIQLAKTDIR